MIFRWIQQLRDLWGKIVPLFGRFWTFLIQFKEKTLGIFTNLENLLTSAETVFTSIRDFDIQPSWRNRVISAPRAVETIQQMLTVVPQDIIEQVRGIVTDVRTKIGTESFELSDIEGMEGFSAKLVKAGEKLLAWAALIIDALNTIEDAIDRLQAITDDLQQILDDLQNLDGLFLPQKSPRRYLKDQNIRKRVRLDG